LVTVTSAAPNVSVWVAFDSPLLADDMEFMTLSAEERLALILAIAARSAAPEASAVAWNLSVLFLYPSATRRYVRLQSQSGSV